VVGGGDNETAKDDIIDEYCKSKKLEQDTEKLVKNVQDALKRKNNVL
jgi:hypothetical protein